MKMIHARLDKSAISGYKEYFCNSDVVVVREFINSIKSQSQLGAIPEIASCCNFLIWSYFNVERSKTVDKRFRLRKRDRRTSFGVFNDYVYVFIWE